MLTSHPTDAPLTSIPPAVGLVEWSILSALAVFLVKSGWTHFVSNDQKDRDADRELLLRLIDDLRQSKERQADATLSAIEAVRDELREIKTSVVRHSI